MSKTLRTPPLWSRLDPLSIALTCGFIFVGAVVLVTGILN
jgi:hypothetical protein